MADAKSANPGPTSMPEDRPAPRSNVSLPPDPSPGDNSDLGKLNQRLAEANAEYAELMADLDQRNESLKKTNRELARVNAYAAELMANLEVREEENRCLNRSLSAANVNAAELLADREMHLEQLAQINGELKQEILKKVKAYEELSKAMGEIKSLQAILPICSYCKKIRDGDGYWSEVEAYISNKTDTRFSHSFCDKCLDEHYPED